MKKTLLAATICLACGPAMASSDSKDDPWTQKGMYEAAKVLGSYTYGTDLPEQQQVEMTYAMGWFAGALDTMQALGAFSPEQKFICPSRGVTPSEVAREYVDYVDSHHGHVPDDPMIVLVESLKHNHPCN